jgi:hypothetical protein
LPASSEGFSVSVTETSSNSYTVSFEGWHEDFEDASEALNVIAFGLSGECRLREYRRGGYAYRWTLEALEDGVWKEESTTALIFFPFWKKTKVRYLQNKLISRNDKR